MEDAAEGRPAPHKRDDSGNKQDRTGSHWKQETVQKRHFLTQLSVVVVRSQVLGSTQGGAEITRNCIGSG